MYPCTADQVCDMADMRGPDEDCRKGSGQRENGHTEGMGFLRYAFLRSTGRRERDGHSGRTGL